MPSVRSTLLQIAERNRDTVSVLMDRSREAAFNAQVAKDTGDGTAHAEWQKTAKQWFDVADQIAKDHDAIVALVDTVAG